MNSSEIILLNLAVWGANNPARTLHLMEEDAVRVSETCRVIRKESKHLTLGNVQHSWCCDCGGCHCFLREGVVIPRDPALDGADTGEPSTALASVESV